MGQKTCSRYQEFANIVKGPNIQFQDNGKFETIIFQDIKSNFIAITIIIKKPNNNNNNKKQ